MSTDRDGLAAAVSKESRLQEIAAHGDYFGYDMHARRRARRIATGVAIIILGFAAGRFFALLPERNTADVEEIVKGVDRLIGLMTHEIVELPEVQRHPESFIIEIIGVLIGYTILKHVAEDHDDYRRAFRRIEQFYTPRARRQGWEMCVLCAILATVVIIGVHAAILHWGARWPGEFVAGLSRTSLAIGCWLYIYGFVMGVRTNLFLYNFKALRLINIYELGTQESDERRETRLAEKRLCDFSTSLTSFATILGVLGALALYFLPTLRTSYFWIPLAVTLGMTFVIKWIVVHYAKKKYEPDFD
ncbi:transcriptional regulator [Bifidobacterium pseudolongum subsp. globosum]|uniref:Transcriptional regulator n=1 Tax=Bifidobacterium pseudolongum subsp. globosum TaxID=1690 RepID=A0A4V1Y1R1_9BIFI|nr:transcriptional regulator [Bifidobacterium pseudolongum]RYQ10408.1 transcriptional regulator [Bifidobacterium pseudolongum subsp. globosum]